MFKIVHIPKTSDYANFLPLPSGTKAWLCFAWQLHSMYTCFSVSVLTKIFALNGLFSEKNYFKERLDKGYWFVFKF